MSENTNIIEAIKARELSKIKEILAATPGAGTTRDENGVSALLLAKYYGHREIADAILNSGMKPDIFEAAAVGHIERVREFLKTDPEIINKYSNDGFPPLGLAAFFGHADIVQLLIEKGADVNAPSQNQMQVRPIHSAVAFKDKEVACKIAKMLLENGADGKAKQQGGWTPLHGAANSGSEKLVTLLMSHGANPAEPNDEGKTPFQLAEEKEHRGVIDLLASKLDS